MVRIHALAVACTLLVAPVLVQAQSTDCPNGGTIRFGVEPYKAAPRLTLIYNHIGELDQ
ncbi:MAG: hypothetical protein JO122_01320 [Acetobacteraceae bacterium]|nr:hypothetical protein [Acetobacteraceae bacterium]